MLALQSGEGARYRFFPLPARYNWRYSTLHPPTGPAAPAVLHHRDVGAADVLDLARRVSATVSAHMDAGVREAGGALAQAKAAAKAAAQARVRAQAAGRAGESRRNNDAGDL